MLTFIYLFCDAFTISKNKKARIHNYQIYKTVFKQVAKAAWMFFGFVLHWSTVIYLLELKVSESFASLIHYRQCWQFVTLFQLAFETLFSNHACSSVLQWTHLWWFMVMALVMMSSRIISLSDHCHKWVLSEKIWCSKLECFTLKKQPCSGLLFVRIDLNHSDWVK
jgi:hypothetical protein